MIFCFLLLVCLVDRFVFACSFVWQYVYILLSYPVRSLIVRSFVSSFVRCCMYTSYILMYVLFCLIVNVFCLVVIFFIWSLAGEPGAGGERWCEARGGSAHKPRQGSTGR